MKVALVATFSLRWVIKFNNINKINQSLKLTHTKAINIQYQQDKINHEQH